jgi:penicillin-binding protein 2
MRESRVIRGQIFRIVVIGLFVVLSVNLFILQVPRHAIYKAQALQNRQIRTRVKAPRGLIRDREGTILADNLYAADVTVPARVLTPEGPDSTLARLIRWWRLDPEATAERLRQQRKRGRDPVVLVSNARASQIHAVEEYHHALPGVRVETHARRRYLHGPQFAHIVGYVGEVSGSDIREDDDERRAYRQGDVIGKMGAEAACESNLRGYDGVKLEEINAGGRVVRRPTEAWQMVQPVPGADVRLTLAVALQESLFAALAGRPGCAVALGLPSGEILAGVSSPAFDPNRLTLALTTTEWEALASDPKRPFFNRIVQGTYAPGSLYKVVTSLCGLHYRVIGPASQLEPCYGSYRFGNRTFRCWKAGGHGVLDHTEALVHSCDVFYYQLGLRLTLEELHETATFLGLGRTCCSFFPEEVTGNIPTSAWYDARYGHGGWTRGVLLNNAIGQGEILVTPLQMAVLAGAVATDGRMGAPRVLLEAATAPEPFLQLPFAPEHLAWARRALQQVVDSGTGAAARLAGITVAGKTGTAQNPHGDDHAWFMCYAPAEAPEVAMAVILENAGHGGALAAPLAGRWLSAYFAWAAARKGA